MRGQHLTQTNIWKLRGDSTNPRKFHPTGNARDVAPEIQYGRNAPTSNYRNVKLYEIVVTWMCKYNLEIIYMRIINSNYKIYPNGFTQ